MHTAYATCWKFCDDAFDVTTWQHWFAIVNQHCLVGVKRIKHRTLAVYPRPVALTTRNAGAERSALRNGQFYRYICKEC